MKIIFICTGNTCRSCMAEAIFNKLSNMEDCIAISAGVQIVKGSKISKFAVDVLKENLEINISGREAVAFSEDLINDTNFILTMTSSIKNILIKNFPCYKNKIFSLTEFVGIHGDILDPYGGDKLAYANTFRCLIESITLLIDKLKEDNCIQQ